jgi:hypothetical protein
MSLTTWLPNLYIIPRNVWSVICSISSEATGGIGSVDLYIGFFLFPEDAPLFLESQFSAQNMFFVVFMYELAIY